MDYFQPLNIEITQGLGAPQIDFSDGSVIAFAGSRYDRAGYDGNIVKNEAPNHALKDILTQCSLYIPKTSRLLQLRVYDGLCEIVYLRR